MNIKKLLTALLATVMVMSLSACGGKGSAQGNTKEESTAEVQKLKVGTEAGFAPYEYMEGNNVVGVDMDIAAEIAKSLGMELEIINMDFDGALMAVQQGKVDIVAAAVSVDPERANAMDFSVPYVDSKEVIIVNKENPGVSEATVEALEGKVIGVQQGNIADIWVENNVKTDSNNIKRYTKFAQAAEDLKNNKIDCIVIDELPGNELVNANPQFVALDGVIFEDNYAIAIKKGNTEMLENVNKVIEKLISEGKIEEFIANHAKK